MENRSIGTSEEIGPGFVLNDGVATAQLRRADTRNGMRLEILAPRLRRSIHLDSVALESLTWQTPEKLSGLPKVGDMTVEQPKPSPLEPHNEDAGDLTLTNEFSTVRVRRVDTDDGPRAEVSSPRLQTSILLDAATLELLSCQTMETFSGFLETPLGEETDH